MLLAAVSSAQLHVQLVQSAGSPRSPKAADTCPVLASVAAAKAALSCNSHNSIKYRDLKEMICIITSRF
jgi:hypothetical protein